MVVFLMRSVISNLNYETGEMLVRYRIMRAKIAQRIEEIKKTFPGSSSCFQHLCREELFIQAS